MSEQHEHAWTSIRRMVDEDDPQICTYCGERRTIPAHDYLRGADRIERGAPPLTDEEYDRMTRRPST